MDLLPALRPGSLIVVCAPHAARDETSALAAVLALRGPLTILDGGNRLQPYRIAHLLRRETVDVRAAAERIFLRRAFTCYQLAALLDDTPALARPYLILDLLASFYDDHVDLPEARRLLTGCLRRLADLNRSAPVLVTLTPPLTAERAGLVEQVCRQAGQVLALDPVPPPAFQPALF